MSPKPLTTAFAALVLLLPTTASVRAGDDPADRVIVVPDVENDVEVVEPNFEIADRDEPESLVVRVDRDHGRGYLGVRLVDLTPELREYFGVPRDAGVLVGSVEADSPAGKAGLKVGDVVTAADGDRVDSPRDLTRAIRRKKAGDQVRLDLARERAKKQITVTVGERPEREVRIGALPHMHNRSFVWKDKDFDKLMPLEGRGQFEQRLDDLEKRLKDLEKKLPR